MKVKAFSVSDLFYACILYFQPFHTCIIIVDFFFVLESELTGPLSFSFRFSSFLFTFYEISFMSF